MKVHFFMPESFLRTKERTNPYFDPIIKVARGNGIDYRVFVPCRNLPASGYGDKLASCACLVYPGILGDKLVVWFRLPKRLVFNIIGWFVNVVTLGRFRSDVSITIAGQDYEILAGINWANRLVDVQHGVVYSSHSGYFVEGKRAKNTWACREFWLYGQGYADCFFKNPENHKWLDGRVKVVGDLLGMKRGSDEKMSAKRLEIIAVSLQFTPDFGKDILQTWADDLCGVFEQIEAAGLQKRFPVVMRHHPRFDNSFDMGPMMKRFPWLQLTEESTNELIAKAAYHITYMSTSAFEYAAEGVPTLFTASEKNRVAVDMMYGEFGYPVPLEFQQMVNALNGEKELARQGELVRVWYKKFYAPFDAENCLKLLKGEA